tara:strand:- start:99 stop:851 length:753 start_codon:yes stop_codon:yes gene_type:complete
MKNYSTNQERTEEYLDKFNREKVLKLLVGNEKPVIFDVGANDGSSIIEFKSWWPESTVHSFEPQEECWAKLEEQAAIYSDSVIVNKIGVGAEKSNGLTFYTHNITTGQSGFHRINAKSSDSIRLKELGSSPNELSSYQASLNHSRTVPLLTLGNYITEKKIEKVNMLKIDTQGYEPEVLSGLGDQLAKIDVVLTELMFYDFYERSLSFSDIEQYLLPAGFQLYDISHISKNPMNGRTDWVDVIYLNKSSN